MDERSKAEKFLGARVETGVGMQKLGSSSSTHDGMMAEFEFQIVQIAESAGLVNHP